MLIKKMEEDELSVYVPYIVVIEEGEKKKWAK